jgi:hypothetical protein
MNLWEIVKNVGSAALQVALPGTGSLIVGAINAALSDDKQLPQHATGSEVQDALVHVPSDQRAALMDKQFDVTIEQLKQAGESNRAMLAAEAISTHTTRPKIALGAFHVVAYAEIVAISIWAYAVINSDDPLKSVTDGWAFIVAVTLPFVGLLNAYFGILKNEQADKLNASQGNPTRSGLSGIVSALLKR